LNNAAGNFISPTERLSANAFDTVIDIVLKDLKLYSLFGKHWIDTKQTSSTILNIVTTYAFTGSAYVVQVPPQKRSSGHDKKSCSRMG
jgi:hypothetical protein